MRNFVNGDQRANDYNRLPGFEYLTPFILVRFRDHQMFLLMWDFRGMTVLATSVKFTKIMSDSDTFTRTVVVDSDVLL